MPEPLTPEEQIALDILNDDKKNTKARLVSHMDGVGISIMSLYPKVEVMSWPIQGPEADVVVALGETATLALDEPGARAIANYLVDTCAAHFGPVETWADRAEQLWAKAVVVKAKSELFLSLSSFVNGLRARADDRVDAATSREQLFIIESEIQTELGAFRTLYGV